MKEKEMECVYPRSPNENFPEIISADIQSCILNAICVGLMRSWNFNWCWCVTNLKKNCPHITFVLFGKCFRIKATIKLVYWYDMLQEIKAKKNHAPTSHVPIRRQQKAQRILVIWEHLHENPKGRVCHV